ncbi:unnamed protein product [Paramecium sonneborni]|uniref:Uncharacterized protein n=1 Tax=Paramecium sonneborni TaxID=65129 RepID=A0A8S1RU86_9CILI|nr:unnamed protein product [Paramecium sonneborni]
MSRGPYQQRHQILVLQQNVKQEEALIEFYVYQDLQNLINLLFSREAVLEHLQNDQNNPMVTLSNNKVILQFNLSSGIHQDLKNQYQHNRQLSDKLRSEKMIALRTLNYVVKLDIKITNKNSYMIQSEIIQSNLYQIMNWTNLINFNYRKLIIKFNLMSKFYQKFYPQCKLLIPRQISQDRMATIRNQHMKNQQEEQKTIII